MERLWLHSALQLLIEVNFVSSDFANGERLFSLSDTRPEAEAEIWARNKRNHDGIKKLKDQKLKENVTWFAKIETDKTVHRIGKTEETAIICRRDDADWLLKNI